MFWGLSRKLHSERRTICELENSLRVGRWHAPLVSWCLISLSDVHTSELSPFWDSFSLDWTDFNPKPAFNWNHCGHLAASQTTNRYKQRFVFEHQSKTNHVSFHFIFFFTTGYRRCLLCLRRRSRDVRVKERAVGGGGGGGRGGREEEGGGRVLITGPSH